MRLINLLDSLPPIEKKDYTEGNLKGLTLICFYDKIKKESFLALVQPQNTSMKLVDQIIKTVTFPIEKKENIEIKLVGKKEFTSELFDLFEKRGFKISSLLQRESPDVKFYYYTSTGRLRIEKDKIINEKEIKKPELKKIKVLIVDDSATIRKLLRSIFSNVPDFEVVSAAEKPSHVEELIKKYKPDVITLDIHMPEMDGVTLLKEIYPKYSIPTVMISSISMDEGPLVLDSLEAGAIDYIQKPTFDKLKELAPQIVEKVRMAAHSKAIKLSSNEKNTKVNLHEQLNQKTIVAIGSSTGGTEALREVLTRLPNNIPPILIVQHIPAVFSGALAKRLNELCPFEVKEAQNGDPVKENQVLIAPGGKQMKIKKSATGYQVQVTDDLPINLHKPSVDVLFDSVAEHVGKDAIGIILTGMGADGAKGIKNMKTKGARTIAQDEKSCVVFGMPQCAIKLGCIDRVSPLFEIPSILSLWLKKQQKAA